MFTDLKGHYLPRCYFSGQSLWHHTSTCRRLPGRFSAKNTMFYLNTFKSNQDTYQYIYSRSRRENAPFKISIVTWSRNLFKNINKIAFWRWVILHVQIDNEHQSFLICIWKSLFPLPLHIPSVPINTHNK